MDLKIFHDPSLEKFSDSVAFPSLKKSKKAGPDGLPDLFILLIFIILTGLTYCWQPGLIF
jgi:hypothetical protein